MDEAMSSGTEPGRDYLVVDSPYEVANWRPLVHWLMYIPHALIIYVLRAVASVVFVIYWIALLVTGRPNPGMYAFLVMYERYQTRAGGFLIGYTELYPPFDFSTGARDNGAHPPIRISLPDPPDSTSRVACLQIIMAIPHYLVLLAYFIAAAFVLVIGWFAVLFTGSWPSDLRDFLVRVGNYYLRVWAYAFGMVDSDYPKFGL